MAKRNQLPPWHERKRLNNGREILIRPIRPEDRAPLEAALPLFEPAALRPRLAAAIAGREAAPLFPADPRTDFVLVASEPYSPGESLIAAVAHLHVLPERRDAEFTILVSRHVRGRGLARHLLQRLARWAKGRGLERVSGEVLQANEPLLDMADTLGFQAEDSAGDDDLVRVVLDLSDTEGDATEVDAG